MLTTFSCRSRDSERLDSDDIPVVLISVDTLRSDRLPAYGYTGVATPAIDALRADSILFERAYSQVPLTLPSHATILTGLLPSGHQVRDNMGYRLNTEVLPSLPRSLKDSGFATGAAVSAFVLRASTGISAHFDFFDDEIEVRTRTSLGNLQRSGFDTLVAAKPWLESVRDRPFFFFFHIYEPHTPHTPPEPFASRYEDLYDGEVATADAVVGRLLAELRQLGVYDRSLIIFLSDHGEGLWDHGALEHMVLLNREVIQVPLMIKLPFSRRAGESVSQPAQLVDILPTVLETLGLETPADLPGTSLLQLDDEDQPRKVYSETHYPRLHFGWSQMASLTDGRYHYIHGPDPELFDLLSDPGETQNILRDQRRIYGEMKQEIEKYDLEIQPPSEVDPEAQEKLAALGYLGSVGGETSGPLADPKTKLHVLRYLQEAQQATAHDDFERAIEILQKTLREEPLLTDAWQELARSLAQLGQLEEAEEAIVEAMRLSSGTPEVAHIAAEIYKDLGRLDEAKAHAELATEGSDAAWELLAEIAIEEQDLTAAASYVDEALRDRGTRIGPLLALAALRVAQDRQLEAIEVTETAENEFEGRTDREQLRGLYFTRGKAYALLGDTESARHAFQAEIEIDPRSLGAYTHLAFLYALDNEAPLAGETLRRMVEANPNPSGYIAAVVALREMRDGRSAETVLRMALGRWPDNQRLLELDTQDPRGS